MTEKKYMTHEDEEFDFLLMLGRGAFISDLHEKRRALEKAIAETGKKGSLTIKIKVEPGGGSRRVFSYAIKCDKPEAPNESTWAFATEQGQYVENDPSQKEFAFVPEAKEKPAPTLTFVPEPKPAPAPAPVPATTQPTE